MRTEVGTANDVGMELVRIAEHDNVDMIVIATHGMTGWRRIAVGSVAQKVVEQAACPVLVLRAKAGDHAANLRLIRPPPVWRRWMSRRVPALTSPRWRGN